MRALVIVVAAIAGIGIMVACGEEAPPPTPTAMPTATAVPPTPTAVPINEVTITAADYSFSGPSTIAAGVTKLTMVNAGQELHHATMIKLPEDMALDDLLAGFASEEAGPLPEGMVLAGGPGSVEPGSASNTTMDLDPGVYALVCFFPDANGVPHVALGMASTLTVTAAEGPAADPPESDLTMDLVDFGFNLPEFSPGDSVSI